MSEKPPMMLEESGEKMPGWMTLEELHVEIKKLEAETDELKERISGDPHARPDASGFIPGKAVEKELFKKQTRLAACVISRDALLGKVTGSE